MPTSTIKILRDINNKSKQEIAEDVLGIPQNTYSRIEKDPKKLTAEQAKKLADFYNVSVTDLLSEAAPIITFKDTKIENGSNGYVHHTQNDNRKSASLSEINSLKEEIAYLRQQNSGLIKALSERK